MGLKGLLVLVGYRLYTISRMIREQIKKDIWKTIDNLPSVAKALAGKQLTIDKLIVEVTRTTDPRFGDFTTNLPLKIKHKNKQSPMKFAKVLADSLKDLPYVKKLEVASPGFINFFIKNEVWQKQVEDLLKKKTLPSDFSGKKVTVEFTDPNPFKEFHVGHLYSNSVGEAISRLLEACGAKVKRANYQGDVGIHVAKAIWGMRKVLVGQGETLKDLMTKSLAKRVAFLGLAYTTGANEFEQNPKVKEEITELNKQIYENLDKIEEYKLGKKWSLGYFEEIYKRLGTRFDYYYFESQVGKVGADLVKKYLGKVFVASDGAVIFPGEKLGLHNRVFISSQGLPTYESKELGLARTKYKDYACDLSIIITGNEIVEYFKVLLAALSQIDPDLASKTKHIAHGMVRMPGGKISSRLGNVLSAEWLLNEAKKRALLILESSKISKDVDRQDVSEKVAVGAVKYALLKGNIGQDITFSFEESVSLEGNCGPYLQYTYARCKSVLEKASHTPGVRRGATKLTPGVSLDNLQKEEEQLLRCLGHFEEAVVDAAGGFSPNVLASFLFEVSQKYNLLYNNLPILKAELAKRTRRLFLTRTTAEVLEKGLYLLGIEALEKM